MNRKELDKKILTAITTLKNEGKSLTVNNIKEITGLLKYQIYSSKHKTLLKVRGKKLKATQAVEVIPKPNTPQAVETASVAAPAEAKTTNIDLFYKLSGTTLTIDLKEATPDSIDDAIENLTFLFKKSIERLQREKSNL
jgi:hypothetical protein